ncbi:hypothetical protein ACFL9T_14290 [Thermodesulfobacteriota bacterium]
MPARYTFSGNLFSIVLEDTYNPEEIIEAFTTALNDPLFPENARFLLDVRKSSILEKRSSEDIRIVSEFFAKHSDRVDGRCAIVASKPVHYGLSRMGAIFSDLEGATVEVFENVSEAVSWLEADEDV